MESKLLTAISSVLCKSNNDLHHLQKLILTQFPEVSHNLLSTDMVGYNFKMAGDLLVLHKCTRIKNYSISWDQQINKTCFNMFPIKIWGSNYKTFLEFNTRRIFSTADVINCTSRLDGIYIKDKEGAFWQFRLPNNFTRFKQKHPFHRHFKLQLPNIAGFNRHLLHYSNVLPHRTTLLGV